MASTQDYAVLSLYVYDVANRDLRKRRPGSVVRVEPSPFSHTARRGG